MKPEPLNPETQNPPEVYLPAEVAFLTGLDDEWKSTKDWEGP